MRVVLPNFNRLFAGLALLLWAYPAWADTSLEISVSAESIGLEETLNLNIQVAVQGQSMSPIPWRRRIYPIGKLSGNPNERHMIQ